MREPRRPLDFPGRRGLLASLLSRRALGLLLVSGLAASFLGVVEGDEVRGKWLPAGELSTGRYAPGAALLPDGRVLVAGGYSFEENRTHASSDLFDPGTGMWSAGPKMRFDRNFPETITLPSGDPLFIAGFRARTGTTATSERFDARTSRFVPDADQGAPPSVEERELFSVVALADGRYLVTGGYSTLRRKTLASAELFDPKTGAFAAVPASLRHARFGHTSVRFPDGRVLIVGGKVLATDERVLPAELFDPKTGTFTVTGSLTVGRDRPTAWLMRAVPGDRAPVRVLIAGGSAKDGGTVPARKSEIYNVATGKFGPGPELIRDRMAHTATPLADGRVLLVGGWSNGDNATTRQAELWDPVQERFLPAGTLQHGRHDHAAVRLRDGRVLVAGGKEAPARNSVESPLAAELWTP